MIYSKLYPDIVYQNKTYTIFNDSKQYLASPLVQLYDDWDGSPLLLQAIGGQGKTTSVLTLQAELLCRGIQCHVYRCGDINQIVLDTINNRVEDLSTLIVFDGWDEASVNVRRAILHKLNTLIIENNRVIVTSRYNPAFNSIIEEEKNIFKHFKLAEICELNKKQILELVKMPLDISSRFFELFSNTIYISMYMGFNLDDKKYFQGVENSFQFIHRYFKLLLNKKGQTIENIDRLLFDVGELIFFEFAGEDSKFASNVNSFSALNNIISEYEDEKGNWCIKTNHMRYKAFCFAVYLKYEFSRYIKNGNRDVPKALSFKFDKDYRNRYVAELYKEALIFVGEGIDIAQISALKSLTNYSVSNSITRNILYILLGANGQCFDDTFFNVEDKDINPTIKYDKMDEIEDEIYYEMEEEGHDLRAFLTNNWSITGICLHRITKVASKSIGKILESLPNLRQISVANDHPCYWSEGNCLLSKDDNSLILGCCNSIIPDCVEIIRDRAFLNCSALEYIEIPNSVKEIHTNAFAGCCDLKELILPDSVVKAYEIITHCESLCKLVIGRGLDNITFETFCLTRYNVFGGPNTYNNLQEIIVSPENPSYYSEGNCLIEKKTQTLILGCKTSIIPDKVNVIGARAFSCIKHDEFVIPYGVKEIGDAAFAGATITRCILPESVEFLGDMVFLRCYYLEDAEVRESLRTVGDDIFFRSSIQRLIVPEGDQLYVNSGKVGGISYSAYHRCMIGDVFARTRNGKLLPPPYYKKVKEEASVIAKEILSNIREFESFSDFQKYIREVMKERIEHTYPSSLYSFDKTHVIKQKAHLFILNIINKSVSIEDFYVKIKVLD